MGDAVAENSQPEPKKRSKRFILLLIAVVLLITVIGGTVFFRLPVFRQASYGPGPIDIEVTTDKPSYLKGERIKFIAYVNNFQNWSVIEPDFADFQISMNGSIIERRCVFMDFSIDDIPVFPAHSQTSYEPPLSWEQKADINGTFAQVPSGVYTLILTLQGSGYSNTGNFTFEIR